MQEYYIFSIKWSIRGDNLTWWGPNNCDYTSRLERAGRYTEEQIKANPDYYNNHESTMAIPCEEAEKIAFKMIPREPENREFLASVAMKKMLKERER